MIVDVLTEAIVTAAVQAAMPHELRDGPKHCHEVQELFAKRRGEGCPQERKALSKEIWRALRRECRWKEDLMLDKIAESRGGAKQINKLSKESKRRVTIAKGTDGKLYDSTERICEVFGAFYEYLYKGEEAEDAS